jgi:hypothetical protein
MARILPSTLADQSLAVAATVAAALTIVKTIIAIECPTRPSIGRAEHHSRNAM